MGVRGLINYINDIETLWTQIELRRTKLIIDGSSLCNYLYESSDFDSRYGGQYYEFYNVVLSFFDALDSKGVESFVILDGAQDSSGKKLDTDKKRAKEMIETSDKLAYHSLSTDFLPPLLSKLVFIQALRDRGIKFAVCDSEAGAEIAILANAWNCPVLSNDSDFFIFDIEAGYIPLFSLNWKSVRLPSKIFHRRKLASHFQIHEELLPLFASLAGNDYVSGDDALEPFFRRIQTLTGIDHLSRKEGRFATIANVLSDDAIETVESVFREVSRYDGGQLEEAVGHSLQEYTKKESNLFPYFQDGVVCSSLRTQNDREIYEWVLRRFREGQFSTNCMSGLTAGKVFLKAQVENCQEVSANYCSRLLRQYAYGILNDAAAHNGEGNITMVEEWNREGMMVRPTNVPPILSDKIYLIVKPGNESPNHDQEGMVLSASLIPRLNKKYRVLALLDALDSNTAHIKLLPKKFKLIAASLRFLVNNAQPMLEENHLIALLCCCVTLEEDSVERIESAVNRKPSKLDRKAAHSFCQWQCVLRDAIDLNFILLEPLATPCIHKTFNGRLVHCLREELNEGVEVKQMLKSPPWPTLGTALL
ncbi:single-strand DNA endonuclease ASTE1-like [Oculina patagonica]